MGATVALYAYLEHDLPFDGMMLSGPGYKPNPKVLGIRFPRFMNVVPMAMSEGLGTMIPGWPAIHADFGLATVIEDPEVQERIENDPYVAHGWLPARYMSAGIKADDVNEERIHELDIPLLILHGEHDMLVPVDSSEQLIEEASSTDKTLKVYPDSPHTNLLDYNRYQVYKDIEQWLDAREGS